MNYSCQLPFLKNKKIYTILFPWLVLNHQIPSFSASLYCKILIVPYYNNILYSYKYNIILLSFYPLACKILCFPILAFLFIFIFLFICLIDNVLLLHDFNLFFHTTYMQFFPDNLLAVHLNYFATRHKQQLVLKF